jgi:hypothetical protein
MERIEFASEHFASGVARRHAPLVQNASAVIATLGGAWRLRLTDAESGALPGDATTVVLARGGNRGWNACPRSAAEGQRLALTYADPASEGAMAALVACSALGPSARRKAGAPSPPIPKAFPCWRWPNALPPARSRADQRPHRHRQGSAQPLHP